MGLHCEVPAGSLAQILAGWKQISQREQVQVGAA